MSGNVTFVCTLACCLVLAPKEASAQGKEDEGGIAGTGIGELNTIRVASGLTLPLYVTAPEGDFNRLFIVEQRSGTTGRIRILDLTTNPPTLQAVGTPYLNVPGVSTGNEQGLLGLAFHPDFLNNGYFYVYYTTASNIVARYRANPPFATSTTAVAAGTILLSIADPFTNHNGGWIAFRPDDTEGYLYVATGDGGSANDPNGNGQNINSLLGKMLRVDVDGADNIPGNDDDDGVIGMTLPPYTSPPTNPFVGVAGADQIWAVGLRNPWRNAFDRATNDLYIADVGQNAWEEIDFQPGSSAGGENYGWRCMEANACTGLTGCTCNAPTLTDPIHAYSHGFGCSVTGGYVYRGSAIPGLPGTYFFTDYCTSTLWTFRYTGTINPLVTNRTAELAPGGGLSIASVTSFGEDAAGEMYIVDQGGEVFKIVPDPLNNACAAATAVGDGTHPVNSITATTDGPDETTACSFGAPTQVINDVWYDYTASCTGTARASLCGANFNTRLIIYGAACPTGAGQAIACNDNFCGTASEVTWPATAGTHYRIRVGGVSGVTSGTASLVLNCDADEECPADTDGDNTVEVDDLLFIINNWDAAGGPADLNKDGTVDVDDLLIVINGWGPCV